jgi:acyl carrier protein
MNSSSNLNALHAVISEVLRLDPGKIVPEAAIHQVDTWNSLTHIELIVTIEERFRVQLTEDEIAAMTSVGEIQRILAARGVGAQ